MANRQASTGPMVTALRVACALLVSAVAWGHEGDPEIVSWASLQSGTPLAPHSVAVVQGEFAQTTSKSEDGLPQPELAGISVEVEGSDEITRPAGIYAAEPKRLVILLPDLPAGAADLTVKRGTESVAHGEFQVRAVSPGLFSAASSGGGLAAAVAVRVNTEDGERTTEDVAFYNEERGAYEPILLNPAATDSDLYLELLGTGIRRASSVSVSIGGVSVPASLLDGPGPSPGFDQVRVGPLPQALARRQLVDIALTADGHRANVVQVAFSPSSGPAVTFSNQVARLFQGRCQTCHRPGEVAPFSLMEYEPAKLWAHSIKQATQSRSMPPWPPVPDHGEFVGERWLSDAELDLIARWVDAGAPEGDSADLPEPLVFDPDWALGEPDVILEIPPFTPDASKTDDYRCFSVPIPESITQRKSAVKVEVQPGNRKIVHHVIVFGDPAGESVALEAANTDGKPGYECFGAAGISLSGFIPAVESYMLGGWAPGMRPMVLPEGSGYYIRPGARTAIQVHYHPDGAAEPDRTRVGLHFSDEPTPNNALMAAAANTSFLIPAGAKDYEVRAEFSLDRLNLPPIVTALLAHTGVFPLNISAVLPHMHLLGRKIRMDKVSAGGEKTPMIRIDDWDFDWQSMYLYTEPVQFHADDRMEVVGIYDNSSDNPHNPNDPPQPVGWGDRTVDEMLIVFFQVDMPDLCVWGICGN